MCRVILAPNDDLTPFDLSAQIFRVNVELSVHYRGQNFFSKKCLKVTFRLEKISFPKFFWNNPFWTTGFHIVLLAYPYK